MALTLNGKREKIKRTDFEALFNSLNLQPKQQQNIFRKMENAKGKWLDLIDKSFLSDDFKIKYKELITDQFKRILP